MVAASIASELTMYSHPSVLACEPPFELAAGPHWRLHTDREYLAAYQRQTVAPCPHPVCVKTLREGCAKPWRGSASRIDQVRDGRARSIARNTLPIT